MKSKHSRSRVAGLKSFRHNPRPQSACGPKLCDLFQKLIMRIEEECYARGELIDVEPAVNGRLHVSDRISESKGDFLRGGRTGFANVITGDRYGVPARGIARAISKDIRHYSEALSRRIN